MVSHREMCRRRGYCFLDEKQPLIQERLDRKVRLIEHFHDVRSGWRAARQAFRVLSALVRKASGAEAVARHLLGRQRFSLAD